MIFRVKTFHLGCEKDFVDFTSLVEASRFANTKREVDHDTIIEVYNDEQLINILILSQYSFIT